MTRYWNPTGSIGHRPAQERTSRERRAAHRHQRERARAVDCVGSADPTDGSVSPIYANLRGLPPLLIQAGSYELLLDDPILLAARAAADDMVVTLEVTPEVPHLSQAFAPMLDEGDVALATRFIFRSADPRSTRTKARSTDPSPRPFRRCNAHKRDPQVAAHIAGSDRARAGAGAGSRYFYND
jgi:acetyl esterase/lipase